MRFSSSHHRRGSLSAVLLVFWCVTMQEGAEHKANDSTGNIRQSQAAPDPALRDLLARAGAYAVGYRKLCRDLVAEERMIQKEYDRKGKLKKQRSFISDYLFVALPSAPDFTVEFRDVVSIDGKPVPRSSQGLLELFRKKSSNAFEEARRVTQESTKQNLGKKRTSNMVNFCLSFLIPQFQRGIEYQSLPPQNSTEADEFVLQFRELTDETRLGAVTPMGRKPIPSQGRIWLSKPDAKVLKIDFTFRQEQEFYPIFGRYLIEYQPGVDNLLLPHRFEEYFYDTKEPERVLFESVATYSNFRHFSVDVKILPNDPSLNLSQ
jgi:hypothetical protein